MYFCFRFLCFGYAISNRNRFQAHFNFSYMTCFSFHIEIHVPVVHLFFHAANIHISDCCGSSIKFTVNDKPYSLYSIYFVCNRFFRIYFSSSQNIYIFECYCFVLAMKVNVHVIWCSMEKSNSASVRD